MKKEIIIVLLILLMILPGCSDDKGEVSSGNEPLQIVIEDEVTVDSYSVLLDDSYVFFSFDDSLLVFYRRYFDGSLIEIGTVEDFVFSLDAYTLRGDNLYVWITKAASQEAVLLNDEYVNVIYCVDTETNQLSEVYSESTCLPGAYMASIDNYIVNRQSIRTEDNYLITYLELFNPETGEIEKSSEPFYLNDNTNVGVYMINMCADDNLIYALVDERFEDGTNSPVIYVYNNNLEVTDEINMDSVSEYILSSRVGDMCVWGNCIYMGNYYLEAFVGVIEDGSIKCLLQGESLEAAIQYDTDCDPLFFVRGSNVFYDFDSSSNSLKEIELELDGDYKISNVMIESDNVLVDLTYYATDYDDVKPDRIYWVSRDSLEKVS